MPRYFGVLVKQPNMVLIIADHHRGDYLGCLGAPVLTPNLDQMAGAGAVLRRISIRWRARGRCFAGCIAWHRPVYRRGSR